MSKSENSVRNRRVIACAVLGMSAAASSAFGQSSATWISTGLGSANIGGNWAAGANWTTGVPVDGGGVATFPEAAGFRADFLNTPQSDLVNITNSFAVSQVNIGSVGEYQFTASSAGSLTFTGAAVLNVTGSPANSLRTEGGGTTHQFNTPIFGTAGLTKSGTGAITLTVPNFFSGGTTITGGMLVAKDTGLGTAGASLTLNGGTFAYKGASFFSGYQSSRPISVGPSGGTLIGGDATFDGQITGSGTLTVKTTGVATLTASSPFTGNFVQSGVYASSPQVTLLDGGSLSNAASVDVTGTLMFDSQSGVTANRLKDTGTLISRGATIQYFNAGVTAAEQIGTLHLSGGLTTIDFSNISGATGLSMASLEREPTATLYSGGANSGTVTVTSSGGLTLSSTGNGTGMGTGMLPWAVNATGASAGNHFLTYNATTHLLTPLTAAQVTNVAANKLVTATTGSNNYVFAGGTAQTFNAGATTNSFTVNSLELVGTNPIKIGTNAPTGFFLQVNSGGVLIDGGSSDSVTPVIFPIHFDDVVSGTHVQGVLNVYHELDTSNTFSGQGGILKTGPKPWKISYETAAMASTYTGPTILNGGATYVPGDIAADGTPSAFGAGTSATSPIKIIGSTVPPGSSGGTTVYFAYSSAPTGVTVSRDIAVTGDSAAHMAIVAAFDPASTVTYAGNVSLTSATSVLTLGQGTHVFAGGISGPGQITDQGLGNTLVFNGSSGFSGGTHMFKATYVLGDDNALGTGLIDVSGQGSSVPTIAAANGDRTIANAVLLQTEAKFGTFGAVPYALTFTGTVDLNGSQAGNNSTLQYFGAGASVTFAGVVTHGAVFKDGPGTLVMSNPSNTYLGDTYATGGLLLMTAAVRNRQPLVVEPGGPGSLFSPSGPTATTILLAPPAAPAAHAVVGEFSSLIANSTASYIGGVTTTYLGKIAVAPTDRGVNQPTVLITDTVVLTPSAVAAPAFPAGVVDLGNNDMLVHTTSAEQLGTYVATGHLVASTSNPLAGLGVITNSDGRGGTLYPTFDGIASVATDTLVKYTYLGDTDLNGIVDSVDLANLVAGMDGGLKGWINGDINYDGVVDGTDLALLNASLLGETGSFGNPGGGASGAVPEPGAVTLLIPAVALLGRRRRAGVAAK